MSNVWYELVSGNTPLMQGDLIFDCPILAWSDKATEPSETWENQTAQGLVDAVAADVVVMTQACDLEQGHISNVVLCPHDSLNDYRIVGAEAIEAKGQNPNGKSAWKSHCDDIKDGYLWNLALLSSGSVQNVEIDIRVVDFHEIYTLPRLFLERQLQLRNQPRLRLLPPYREHLSQAFARYFMRVGLPNPIPRSW